MAVGVAISVLSTNPIIFPISAILLGGTFVGITAVGLIESSQLAVNCIRQAFGYMTASFGLGQMIGPYIAGELFTIFGSFFPASALASFVINICSNINNLAKSLLNYFNQFGETSYRVDRLTILPS